MASRPCGKTRSSVTRVSCGSVRPECGLTRVLKLRRVLDTDLPTGVNAQLRTDGKREFVFLLNFTSTRQELKLGPGKFRDLATGQSMTGTVAMAGYGALVLERS